MSKTRRSKPPAPPLPSEDTPQTPPTPWRFQFSLRTMLVSTALCCVLAAVLGGLLRATQDPEAVDFKNLIFFLVLAVGAPMFVMMAASFIGPVRRLTARLRQRKDEP